MKFLKALFVLALVLTFAVPAFAETQNVKVSGSIDAYWFYRSNWDLRDNNDQAVVPVHQFDDFPPVISTSHTSSDPARRSEADDYFFTLTQVEVSADLTDNVSVVINLLNQRDWNTPDQDNEDDFTDDGDEEFNVQLDLAYVQMREIFYSPLTLTIGRQDLWFGRGLIVGSNWRSWDGNTTDDFEGQIQADEYSGKTAFDAIRATLDFNPWTLDFVYSKIDENTHNAEDDIDLYVVNVNYKFSEYNAVAEVYWVTENDRGSIPTAFETDEDGATRNNDTHTIGGRVQFDPISQITLGGELAYQFGHYRSPFDNSGVPGSEFNPERDRSAWMFDVFGTYRWDMTWKPELTIEYVHFSGEENLESNTTDEYNAWNSLYRGKFYTAYADFREFIYKTGDPVDQSALQNEQFIQFKGSMKPLQDLLIEASWTYLWTDEDIHIRKQGSSGDPNTVSGSPTRDSELGWEVDLQVTYDYTEDVSFSSLFSVFVPGDFYDGALAQDSGGTEFDADGSRGPSEDNAWSVVNSVKVTF